MPASSSSTFARESVPTRSASSTLPSATTCDAFATESFGRFVVRADNRTWPGASAHSRLLVSGPERSPLGPPEHALSCGCDKAVGLLVHQGAHTIHRFGHLVGGVARDILAKGSAENFAPGPSRSSSESFDFLKHFVRDRNGRFHTRSITEEFRRIVP